MNLLYLNGKGVLIILELYDIQFPLFIRFRYYKYFFSLTTYDCIAASTLYLEDKAQKFFFIQNNPEKHIYKQFDNI